MIVVLSILIAAYLANFLLTMKPMKVSREFFDYIRGSRYSYAYELTASKFQENTSMEAFVDYSNSLSLKESVKFSSFWRIRGMKVAKLYGKLVYSDHKVPLMVNLVKVGDEWRIATLKTEVEREHFAAPEPTEEEVVLILQKTLSNLIYGVKSGDFTDLYLSLAVKLKEQLTPEFLAREFLSLIHI